MAIRQLQHTGKLLQAESAVDGSLAVVRELVDNAIDACASSITVAVDAQTGGLHHISVRDDGCGVHKEDFQLVFAQACTSKHTGGCLGFRGEALHLITCVAKECRITTKTATDTTAAQWDVQPPDHDACQRSTDDLSKFGPLPLAVKCVASPTGTTVVIKDLFHNTPVRRKLLLKRPVSKSINSIESLLKRYAIIHAPTRFAFKLITKYSGYRETQSTTRFVSPSHSNARALLAHWSSTSLTTSSLSLPNAASEIIITAPAAVTLSAAPNVEHFSPIISVNKRLLSMTRGTGKDFKHTFNTVFTQLFPQHRNPGNVPWMIMIQCPESHIDSNIEPKKDDVILRDHDAILATFENTLKEILLSITTHESTSTNPVTANKVAGQQGSDARSSFSKFQVVDQTETNTRNEVHTAKSHVPKSTELHGQQRHREAAVLQSLDSESDSEPSNADQSWSRTMHDKLSSETDSQFADPSTVNTDASNTSNASFPQDIDEDFSLANDITISNPFTLMKMRSISKTKKSFNPTSISLGINASEISPHPDQAPPIKKRNYSIIKRTCNQSAPPHKKLKSTHGLTTTTKHPNTHTKEHKSALLADSDGSITKFMQSRLHFMKSPDPLISAVGESASSYPSVRTEVCLTDVQVRYSAVVGEWKGDCVIYTDDEQSKTDTIDSVVRWIYNKVNNPTGAPIVEELEGWWLATYD